MKITQQSQSINIAGAALRIRRTTGGVVELRGRDTNELAAGLGFVHAHDRLVQMMLVRLVGRGRLCECLHDSDETLAIDGFMRQMGFTHLAREEAARLPPDALAFAESYAAGVNHHLRNHARPLELVLAGYRPEPWEVADTLLTIHLMAYAGLAQTQQDLEKFLIQSIQGGVDVARLKRLFAPHLDGLTEELVALIRQVRVMQPLVPAFGPVPRLLASNNWAVAPSKSASGFALQCNDPHLEANRLPAVWYEAVLHAPHDYQIGVTMPGVPGVCMGRSRNLSAGFTYGFMDMVDYFIEECLDGKYRRNDGWHSFRVRRENIHRKKHAPVEVTAYESDCGTIETDPREAALPDGYHLCRAFAPQQGGAGRALAALARMPGLRSVPEAQRVLREVSISCNWVIADREGNIGYQQSGLLPARAHSGLYPVPAWQPEMAWRGLVPADQLATSLNPPEGFIATANEDRNQPGQPLSVNVSQGPYRVERISELLTSEEKLTVADMQRFQSDLVAPQARRFMTALRALIPDTPAGRLLAAWDLRYDASSRGASLFEDFYERLLREVFGKGLFGLEAWDAVSSTTSLVIAYFYRFDEALLGDDPIWFGGRTREDVFRDVLVCTLDVPIDRVRTWGQRRQMTMHNLFFGGKLPAWLARLLGIDRGPIALEGNRSTVVQGAVFRSHGRPSSFAPSYRFVTDLGTDEVHTSLAGGPSGWFLSPWYASDLERWRHYQYKTLAGIAGDEKLGR